jgi:hypothetical protein
MYFEIGHLSGIKNSYKTSEDKELIYLETAFEYNFCPH